MTDGRTERDREGIFGLLPDELLPQVFGWLPQSEVLEVIPQVCKRWAREATNDKRPIVLHVEKDWPVWKRRQALLWKRVQQITIDELTDRSALVCAEQAQRGVREAKINVTMLLKLVKNLEELSFYRKAPFVNDGKALVWRINRFMEQAVTAGMRMELLFEGKYGRRRPKPSVRQEWMKRDGVTWGKIRTHDPWAGHPGLGISRNGDLVRHIGVQAQLPGFPGFWCGIDLETGVGARGGRCGSSGW